MKKHLNIWLPIVTLIIGLAVGFLASAYFYNRWIGSYMKDVEFNNLAQESRILMQLRAGKTNEAFEMMETSMDGDIIGFGAFLREMPADEHRQRDMKLLTRVRDYRASHPWKAEGYPDIDKGVADVFSLISTNQSK